MANKIPVKLRLNPTKKELINEICKIEGITFTAFVENAMQKKIDLYVKAIEIRTEQKTN